MKVYMIYGGANDIRPGSEPDDSSGVKEIYAITNQKKLYKEFSRTRDMKKFIVKIIRVEGKKEYADLASRYRECVLEKSSFYSKKDNPYPKDMNSSFIDCVELYEFPITYLEKQSVTEACSTFFEHVDQDLPNPYILNGSLRRILKQMGLYYIYKLTRFPYIGDDAMYCTNEEIVRRSSNEKMKYEDMIFLREDMDFTMPDIWVDELEIFLKIYGHLMNLS